MDAAYVFLLFSTAVASVAIMALTATNVKAHEKEIEALKKRVEETFKQGQETHLEVIKQQALTSAGLVDLETQQKHYQADLARMEAREQATQKPETIRLADGREVPADHLQPINPGGVRYLDPNFGKQLDALLGIDNGVDH